GPIPRDRCAPLLRECSARAAPKKVAGSYASPPKPVNPRCSGSGGAGVCPPLRRSLHLEIEGLEDNTVDREIDAIGADRPAIGRLGEVSVEDIHALGDVEIG